MFAAGGAGLNPGGLIAAPVVLKLFAYTMKPLFQPSYHGNDFYS